MKKLYILIALTSLFFVQSCDKFLDLKPENIQVVSTIEDYRDILASYMRLLKTVDGSQKPVLGGYFFISLVQRGLNICLSFRGTHH